MTNSVPPRQTTPARVANDDTASTSSAYYVVVWGLVALGVVFVGASAVVALVTGAAAPETAIVSSVVGVIGAIVGAFFGIQAGGKGRQDAEQARQIAETHSYEWQQKAMQLAVLAAETNQGENRTQVRRIVGIQNLRP